MTAHCDFVQMKAAAHREINVAFVLVHDVDRAKIPTVDFNCLAMIFCCVAFANVKRVRLDNVAVWNLRLKSPDHITRQNIRSVRFARVQFNADFAVNFAINHVVKFDKMRRVDFVGEINLSRRACVLRASDVFTANDRSRFELKNFFSLSLSNIELPDSRANCRNTRHFKKVSPADVHKNFLLKISNQTKSLKVFSNA